jgi:hypothetical protein
VVLPDAGPSNVDSLLRINDVSKPLQSFDAETRHPPRRLSLLCEVSYEGLML